MDELPDDAARRLTVRPAGPRDEALLLDWSNDPVTRASGFHPDPIPPDEHRRWLARRLADERGGLWIGEVDGVPVGTVRVDLDADGSAEVGISVAPALRGRGLARPLLVAGLAAARERSDVARFVAVVRPANAASLGLFRGAGFADAGGGERGGMSYVRLVREERTGD